MLSNALEDKGGWITMTKTRAIGWITIKHITQEQRIFNNLIKLSSQYTIS